MRWIVGGKGVEGQAASTSQMGRFETELLATGGNLAALSDLSGVCIDSVHDHVRRDLRWNPKARLTGGVCLDQGKWRKLASCGGTLPNSGNLVADDTSWLPMVMPAGYKDRHFGRYLGNVGRNLTPIVYTLNLEGWKSPVHRSGAAT